jgi:RNA polymerase subunit RPABC4/transcription elongation factor Spt4
MNKCSVCGRLLNENESDLCPACESDKSHKKKRWVEIGGFVVIIAGGIATHIIKRGGLKL